MLRLLADIEGSTALWKQSPTQSPAITNGSTPTKRHTSSLHAPILARHVSGCGRSGREFVAQENRALRRGDRGLDQREVRGNRAAREDLLAAAQYHGEDPK